MTRDHDGPPRVCLHRLAGSCALLLPASVCGWKYQGRWCQCQYARDSRFCFTWWLLATCFLHSAHSVSHFTLPQAERSIHLVQTLLTGLGWRKPLLGRMRGIQKSLLTGTLVRTAPLTMSLHTPPSLSPVPSWPCKSLWELVVALNAPATSTLTPAPLSTQGAGLHLPSPESPPYLQIGLTLLLCGDNFESFLFYLLTFSSQVEKKLF